MAFTKREIDEMSADEYRQRLKNDPVFLESVNAIEEQTERVAGTRAKLHRQPKNYSVKTSEDIAAEKSAKAARKVLESADKLTQQTLLREHVLHNPLADQFLTYLENGERVRALRVTSDLFALIQDQDPASVRAAYNAFCNKVNEGRNRLVLDSIVEFLGLNLLDPRDPRNWELSFTLLKAAKALNTQIQAEEQDRVRYTPRPKPLAERIEWNGLFGKAALDAMPASEMRQRLMTDKEFSAVVDELLGGNRRAPEAPETTETNNRQAYNAEILLRGFHGQDLTQRQIDNLPSEQYREAMALLGTPVLRVADALKASDGVLDTLRQEHRATYDR
jgi:hypothetical protein